MRSKNWIMAWALQMVYSYMLGSFSTPNFASVPQDCTRKSPRYIIWKQQVIIWGVVLQKVYAEIQLDLWMLVKGFPFLPGLPGVAGQGLSGIWVFWQQSSLSGA